MRLAVPMTLAQLINVLYNIVDRIYIGRMDGGSSLALTGVGVCLPVITVILAFANLIGMGGAPLFSIERGKKNQREAELIQGNCFTLLILLGVILTIIGLLLKRPVLYLLGASDATFPYANAYLTIYLFGNIFVLLSLGMNNFINAQGFGKTGMLTVAIGAGLNMILDPVFIFVLNLGVRGAAIATIISQCVAAVWTLHFLLGGRAVVRLKRNRLMPERKRVLKIMGLGVSGFTMAVTNSLVQMVCNASLQTYGGDVYVGVMTIINSVREVVQMPVSGISSGAQPVMGYNYGAGRNDRVKKSITFMSTVLILYTLGAWLLLFLFPRFFLGIFSSDQAVLEVGVTCLHIYFFGFFMMALQFAGQVTFTALGFSRRAVFFSIFRKVIIVIPLALLLPHIADLGVFGVFLAEPVSNFIGGGVCFFTMMITVYQKMK
ncbi:MAG: MATE family efflux transporter [Lachnospiraceae bacterium]|nr:MATE family efflux transporter [Lachnospiraceae bacterium]